VGMRVYLKKDTALWTVEAQRGQTVLDLLQREGVAGVHAICAGKGTCKKCTVLVYLNDVWSMVLACETLVQDGMTIQIPGEADLQVAESGRCAVFPPDRDGWGYGIACDIGTTTVVCHLCDLKSGRRLATISGGNAQRVFGGDVISRIQASVEGKRQQLTEAVVKQINGFIAGLCVEARVPREEIHLMAIAANTVMSHLFAGLAPDSVGTAPFQGLSLFGECLDAGKLGMSFEGAVYIAPSISGYVGGDITCDLLATQLFYAEQPKLLIDIGTNGEMVLGCGRNFVCCASAAGPAFEGAEITMGMTASQGAISRVAIENGQVVIEVIGGGEPRGICGSGLIDALAVMLELGAVDETGRMPDCNEAPPELQNMIDLEGNEACFFLDKAKRVFITQGDVRRIQLAKAAIYAGVVILAQEYGIQIKDIAQLMLAGGFGSVMNPFSAARIGLIPAELLGVTVTVGNAAGEGAVSALLSAGAREQLAAIQNDCRYIELSSQKQFNDAYIDAMMFGV